MYDTARPLWIGHDVAVKVVESRCAVYSSGLIEGGLWTVWAAHDPSRRMPASELRGAHHRHSGVVTDRFGHRQNIVLPQPFLHQFSSRRSRPSPPEQTSSATQLQAGRGLMRASGVIVDAQELAILYRRHAACGVSGVRPIRVERAALAIYIP